jgi:Aromatic-ring-opening dioxygenase LigAB, LigA subunit
MSRYGMNKALWRLQREGGRAEFLGDRQSALDGCELASEERDALLARDAATLYRLGAHPFLLWGALFDLAGRDPAYRTSYTDAIAPYGYPDHAT